MQIMVLFDLPVLTHSQRKIATRFRNTLEHLGFTMLQYSVYIKHCRSPMQHEPYSNKVKNALPPQGRVDILKLTDKQFERMTSFNQNASRVRRKTPDNYDLFE